MSQTTTLMECRRYRQETWAATNDVHGLQRNIVNRKPGPNYQSHKGRKHLNPILLFSLDYHKSF